MGLLPLRIFFSLHITKVVFISCEFLFLTRIDGLAVNITECCIIYPQGLGSFSQAVLCCQAKDWTPQSGITQCFAGFLWDQKNMLYKCLKFSKQWVHNFCPTPRHYLLVERGNSCTPSILLKRMWLKSSCVNTRKGAWWTYRTVCLWVLFLKKIQVHWLSYSLWTKNHHIP